MTVTHHCPPTLGTGELPPPRFPGSLDPMVPSGAKRGVVVLLHGLNVTDPGGFPCPLNDSISGDVIKNLTLANDLVADGWVVIFPELLGDSYIDGSQNNGILLDINNDSFVSGIRYRTNILRWWDHAIQYIQRVFGNWPVVVAGSSWGGMQSLHIAINKTSTITGYMAQVPAMRPWTLDFFGEWTKAPYNFNGTLSSAMSGQSLPLSAIIVNESISGLTAPDSLVVQSAAGTQYLAYTGINTSTKTFTGVTGGTGALSTGGSVKQSLFASVINVPFDALNTLGNGQAAVPPRGYIAWETADTVVGFANQALLAGTAIANGAPVVSRARTGGGHQMDATDLTDIMAWFTRSTSPFGPDHYAPAVH